MNSPFKWLYLIFVGNEHVLLDEGNLPEHQGTDWTSPSLETGQLLLLLLSVVEVKGIFILLLLLLLLLHLLLGVEGFIFHDSKDTKCTGNFCGWLFGRHRVVCLFLRFCLDGNLRGGKANFVSICSLPINEKEIS